MSSFLKDLSRVGISNITIILSGIATSVVTARYIGPEGNGIIAALILYPSLFLTIGSLGIRQSTAYFLGKEHFPEHRIKTAITQIWCLSTLISVFVCYFLMVKFSRSAEDKLLVWLALIPIPFSLFITYNSGIFLGKNNIKEFNKVNWIPPLITLFLTFILVGVLGLGIKGALISAISGPVYMATLMLLSKDFLKSLNWKFDFIVIKSLLSLGIVYAIALLIINLNYKIDVLILDRLSTSYELGIYSKGAGIIQYLWQIPMLLSTIIFSRSAISKDDYAFSLKVARLLRMSIIFVGLSSIFLFFLSKYIIIAMYGDPFYGSISCLKILLPGVVLLTVFKVMNMDLAGKGKPWVSMKAMIPGLILNILLNVLLIPDLGANGASWASTISYTFSSILFSYFYIKETKIPIYELYKIRRGDFEIILFSIREIINRVN